MTPFWDLVWVSILGLPRLSVCKILTSNMVIPPVLPFSVQGSSVKYLTSVWLSPPQLLQITGEVD